MSDFKVGDRARVVIEGTIGRVATTDSLVRIDTDKGLIFAWASMEATEKLAPLLPTTPGSVVRFSEDGRFAHLNREGEWVADNGGEYSAAAFRSTSTAWDYNVLFDAGAV